MIPFIPRKVASTVAKTQRQPRRPDGTSAGPSASSGQNGSSAVSPKGKQRKADIVKPNLPSDEAYADLLRLSLSDHTLWLDADLRRTTESHNEGYIPLTYLLRHSPYLSASQPPPSEAAVIKAIRAHASHLFDVRVLISEPSRALWYAGASTTTTTGGYEIRLKEWEAVLHRARNSNRSEWEERTVYMENIPLQSRSIPGIYQFTSRILHPHFATDPSSTAHPPLVQAILLPKHHQDKSGDVPKCKGFALVTLSTSEFAMRLIEDWPWRRKRRPTDAISEDVREAFRFGLRVLPKARWEELKAEYLARRADLLQAVARANRRHQLETWEDEDEASEHDEPPAPLKRKRTPSPQPQSSHQTKVTNLASPYPLNCLVFIKNVHPDTNKTTLRALFSCAFAALTRDGLDYVDFTKGMDSCYLRLASPEHTTQLLSYLTQSPLSQTHGLDNTGYASGESEKRITAELVDGKREELYWGKVPEKVRRQAVEKVVRGGGDDQEGPGKQSGDGAGSQRKRQRKKNGE